MTLQTAGLDRRTLLKTLGSVGGGRGVLEVQRGGGSEGGEGKVFNGLYPIASSPFTQDDKLDLDCLGNEVRFCNKGGSRG